MLWRMYFHVVLTLSASSCLGHQPRHIPDVARFLPTGWRKWEVKKSVPELKESPPDPLSPSLTPRHTSHSKLS